MRKFFISCLSVMMIMGSFLLGEEFTIQKITKKSDLLENFCTAFKKGDYLVSDGKYLILIGGTSRNLQSILNYPAADVLGNIIGFIPAGKKLIGDLIAGASIVRIDEKRPFFRHQRAPRGF